jgi:hypothetical protein
MFKRMAPRFFLHGACVVGVWMGFSELWLAAVLGSGCQGMDHTEEKKKQIGINHTREGISHERMWVQVGKRGK